MSEEAHAPHNLICHCEETPPLAGATRQSLGSSLPAPGDCFASLAMTGARVVLASDRCSPPPGDGRRMTNPRFEHGQTV